MNPMFNRIVGSRLASSATLRLALIGIVALCGAARSDGAERYDSDRSDLHGDPLPAGAMARLGTLRLRPEENVIWRSAFSSDGTLLATIGLNTPPVYLWDTKTGRLVRRLEPAAGTSIRPRAIAFSEDSQQLLVGEQSGSARLWEIATGRELVTLQNVHGNKRGVTSVAMAPDGKTFATGGEFGWVRIWNATTGEKIADLQAGKMAPGDKADAPPFSIVVALAYSPDRRSLAAGAGFQPSMMFSLSGPDAEHRAVRNPNGESIVVWDLDSRKRIQEIPQAHKTELVSLAWGAEGTTLVSGGNVVMPVAEFGKPYDSKNVRVAEVKIWSAATGRLQSELKLDDLDAGSGTIAVARGGALLAAGIESAIRLWDVSSVRMLRQISVPGWQGSNGLAISADGRYVVAENSGQLGFWDVASGAPTARFSELHSHHREVIGVRFSSDGDRIFTGSHDGTVRAWISETGAAVYERSLGVAPVVNGIDLSPNGKWLAAGGSQAGRAGGEVPIWSATTGELITKLDSPATTARNTRRLAFSRDGRRLAIANWIAIRNAADVDLWDWDGDVGRKSLEIQPAEWATNLHALAFSDDDKRLYSVTGQPAAVSIWDAGTGALEGEFLLHEEATPEQAKDRKHRMKVWVADAVFSTDSQRVIISREQNIVVWDLRTRRPVQTIVMPGHNKGRHIGLSSDGRWLATADLNYSGENVTKSIYVWDLSTGGQVAQFNSSDGVATAFAFSPDGKRLAAGTTAGTILVWDLGAAPKK